MQGMRALLDFLLREFGLFVALEVRFSMGPRAESRCERGADHDRVGPISGARVRGMMIRGKLDFKLGMWASCVCLSEFWGCLWLWRSGFDGPRAEITV